jgi:hypothetical protein
VALQERLDLGSPARLHGVELGHDLAAAHDREVLAAVLDGVEEAGEVPGRVGGAHLRHAIRLSDWTAGLLFVGGPEAKAVEYRLHLDFRPDDRDLEVDRLLALGATRVDVDQGEAPWVVLATPGNEFCVLGERATP